MTKPTLVLPKTIRFPEENEVPMNSSVLERLRESKNANIVPGYVFKLKDDNPDNIDLPFEFYAEINIDNPQLWSLIITLSEETLPENCALIFGYIDSEINYGFYENKFEICRIKISEPTIKEWLPVDKYEFLVRENENLLKLKNPVLLSYLKTIELDEFKEVVQQPKIIVEKYLHAMLEREKVRQSLKIDHDQQKLILENNNKIKITELCEELKINRKTFYNLNLNIYLKEVCKN